MLLIYFVALLSQIYNGQINDLLDPTQRNLQVHHWQTLVNIWYPVFCSVMLDMLRSKYESVLFSLR